MGKTIQVLNALVNEGLLVRYAVGGAMAATFYCEPVLTFDLGVFVVVPQRPGAVLSLAPLYEALRQRGFAWEGEHVYIEGIPVQFLPAYNPLLEEAVAEARATTYAATATMVLGAEHLAAIAVQTGRAKDRERVRQLLERANMDPNRLAGILARHTLEERWKLWMA